MSDRKKTVARAYGVLRLGFAARHTFYIGPDGRLQHVDREVSPKTAGEDVATRLRALGVATKETTGKS